MTTLYCGEGAVIDFTEPGSGDIASGTVVVVNETAAVLGVALDNIPQDGTGPVAVEGVFDIPKASAGASAHVR